MRISQQLNAKFVSESKIYNKNMQLMLLSFHTIPNHYFLKAGQFNAQKLSPDDITLLIRMFVILASVFAAQIS